MVSSSSLSEVAATLGVRSGELISLVGGGGKTTTLFALGEQLSGTTLLTTTTKMGSEQTNGYPVLIDPSDHALRAELGEAGRALAWKSADDRRATGVSGETCDRWFDIADNVVVEADGSRKRPFKAPAGHEPVLPSRTTLLIACIGASAFGLPIEQSCHRPALVAELAGCSVTDRLTPKRASVVLLSPTGSRKGCPDQARFVVALHRVHSDMASLVDELSEHLGHQTQLIAVREQTRDLG